MIPTPDKIKFQFTDTELLELCEILHFLLTKPRKYDNTAAGILERIQEAGQLDNLRKLYNKVRTKIECISDNKNFHHKFSIKRTEYAAFYVLTVTEQYQFSLKYTMLINKVITEIGKH